MQSFIKIEKLLKVLFSLKTSSFDAIMSGILKIIELTNDGIGAMSNAVRMYDDELDKGVPWPTYNNKCRELDRYRGELTPESGLIVGEIANHLRIAQIEYQAVTQHICEWCGETRNLLSEYRQLFDLRSPLAYDQQRILLMQSLRTGSRKMLAAQDILQRISTNFNDATRKITDLQNRFTIEFVVTSEYYLLQTETIRRQMAQRLTNPASLVSEVDVTRALNQAMNETKRYFNDLKSMAGQSSRDIDSIDTKMRSEIENIDKVITSSEEAKYPIPLHELDAFQDNVMGSITELILQCEVYLIGQNVNV